MLSGLTTLHRSTRVVTPTKNHLPHVPAQLLQQLHILGLILQLALTREVPSVIRRVYVESMDCALPQAPFHQQGFVLCRPSLMQLDSWLGPR